ncbi:TPA: GNAT family N-acetyltransferase [Candidatus Woesearchaeota archaeon]|nr:GNAT family N-acetyltransferase [Candidatus Woesearchaeota archaeon]
MKLRFVDLNRENFDRFEPLLSGSELVYPESIRSVREDFLEMLEEPVAFLAFSDEEDDHAAGRDDSDDGDDDDYVGNVLGCALTPEEVIEYGVRGKGRILYLFNIVVDPGFQGRGVGKSLMAEFLRRAKKHGYDVVAGHFRKNASLSLFKRFGGKEIQLHTDWEGTGEDYVYCEIDLKSYRP